MTREEAERKIAGHLETINRIAQEYGCQGFVSMAARASDGYYYAFNPYWEKESGNPLNFTMCGGEFRSGPVKQEGTADVQG